MQALAEKLWALDLMQALAEKLWALDLMQALAEKLWALDLMQALAENLVRPFRATTPVGPLQATTRAFAGRAVLFRPWTSRKKPSNEHAGA